MKRAFLFLLTSAFCLCAASAQQGGSLVPPSGGGSGDMVSTNNLSDLTSAPTALTNLGGTTVGKAVFSLTNPGAITFLRMNANNTVTARSAANFITDLGATTLAGYGITDAQPLDSDLTAIAALATTSTGRALLTTPALTDGGAPSASNYVPVIAYKTGLDLKTNAISDIFTVPTGQNFVCTGATVEVTAVTAGAAVAFVYKIIESGSSTALTTGAASSSTFPTVSKTFAQGQTGGGSPYVVCVAGNKVQVNITTGFTTSTSVTGTCIVTGYYVP